MRPNTIDSSDPRSLGQRLQEARKARGVTQEEAARSLGIARTTITAIEKGERRIQPDELLRLADIYGREVNELLRQRTLTADFSVQFRLAAGGVTPDVEQMERYRIESQALCEDYAELEQFSGIPPVRRYPQEYDARLVKPEIAAEEIARAERTRLGLGDGAVLGLREILESDVGLRIFEMQLPSAVAGLYVYTDVLGAYVAINALHPEERRRWSLAHEYAHFLVTRFQPDITILRGYQRVPPEERLADSFAMHFLMPEDGLRRRVNERRRAQENIFTVADLLLLAHSYHVSVEAMVNRLEGLDLIPAGTMDRLREQGFKVRIAQETLGLPQPEAAQLLPQRYQYLAVRAFESGTITETQLMRFLRSTDRLEARELAQRLATHEYIDDQGHRLSEILDVSATLLPS